MLEELVDEGTVDRAVEVDADTLSEFIVFAKEAAKNLALREEAFEETVVFFEPAYEDLAFGCVPRVFAFTACFPAEGLAGQFESCFDESVACCGVRLREISEAVAPETGLFFLFSAATGFVEFVDTWIFRKKVG